MSTFTRTLGIAFVTTALAACGGSNLGDDTGPVDMLHIDQAISVPDMTKCEQAIFPGFPGTTAVERRLACPCGCLIDSLEMATTDNLWSTTTVASTLTNSTSGLVIDVDGAQTGASTTLTSANTSGPFYVENDFDLRLDYVLDTLVDGGTDQLRVTLPDNVVYVVTRTRTAGGQDQYTTTLNGTSSTTTTTAASGTLRLLRLGTMLTAFGDSTQIGTLATAESTRVSIAIGSSVMGCPNTPVDGGVGDGGDGCVMSSTLHNLRLVAGTLVDRVN